MATDPFALYANVESRLVLETMPEAQPVLSIVIPTFRRFDLLCEAVASALAQDRTVGGVEVVVVDNDPLSNDAELLAQRVPGIRDVAFRYFVNADNIGMLGNWNRCIDLGRGEWHTMLHDDDLLDPDFTKVLMKTLKRHPEIVGIACRKRNLDQRASGSAPPPNALRRAMRRARDVAMFGFSDHRRITARQLFWASTLGNPTGFICRKDAVVKAGGYRQEYYPSGDHMLFIRFAERFRLAQHRRFLASFRITTNDTTNPQTIKAIILSEWRIKQEVAGHNVPEYWRRLIPLLTSCDFESWNSYWRSNLNKADIEAEIGRKLPTPRKALYLLSKVLARGF